MDETTYGFPSTSDYADKALMSPDNLMMMDYTYNYHPLVSSSAADTIPFYGSAEVAACGFHCSAASSMTPDVRQQGEGGGGGGDRRRDDVDDDDDGSSMMIKAKIASHPCYPKLLHAYIDCQKV